MIEKNLFVNRNNRYSKLTLILGSALIGSICASQERSDLPELEAPIEIILESDEIHYLSSTDWPQGDEGAYEDANELVYSRIVNIVAPMLLDVLDELELRDYQIEPMKQELGTFFVRRILLLSMGKVEIRKAGKDQRKQRQAREETDKKISELYSKTKKNVRAILERKQFRKYNRLINEIAPPPKPRYTADRDNPRSGWPTGYGNGNMRPRQYPLNGN